jgi:hypothetical protein
MTVCWTAFIMIMFIPGLWWSPSYLADALPWLYGPVQQVISLWPAISNAVPSGPLLLFLCYFALTVTLWAAYIKSLHAIRASSAEKSSTHVQRAIGLRFIMLGTLVFGASTLLWMGLFSSDLYGYALLGKMQLVHHLNPVLQAPALMGSDPLLSLTSFGGSRTAYGPVWLETTRLVAPLAELMGGTPVVYVLVYKALNLTLLLVGSWLVWAIGGQLGWTTARRSEATALFAWCPLMVIELVGNGHNEGLLVVCVLAAIWLHLHRAWPLAIAALMCAGLVKLSGFFILPAYLVLLVRSSSGVVEAMRRLGISLGIAVVVLLLAYMPYAGPGLGADLLANPMAGLLANSLASSIIQALSDLALGLRGSLTPSTLSPRQAAEIIRWPVWYGAVMLWGVLMLVFSLRVRDIGGLLHAWGLVLLSSLIIASVWFWPWYICWLVPVLALLPSGRLRRTGLLLAFCGTLSWGLHPIAAYLPGDTPARLFNYYVPAVVFGPVLLYCAWACIQATQHGSWVEGHYRLGKRLDR